MKTHSAQPARPTPGYRMPETDHHLEDPHILDVSLKARARYANIMYDTAFKLIFGSAANKVAQKVGNAFGGGTDPPPAGGRG